MVQKKISSTVNCIVIHLLHICRDSKASDLFGGKVNPAAASRAFKTHYATLVMVIPNTLELASDLYSKGVVSRSLMNKLSALGLSSDEKNILLLNEVEGQISLNPNVFQTFVTSLQSIVPLKEMGKKLIESYCKYCLASFPGLPRFSFSVCIHESGRARKTGKAWSHSSRE